MSRCSQELKYSRSPYCKALGLLDEPGACVGAGESPKKRLGTGTTQVNRRNMWPMYVLTVIGKCQHCPGDRPSRGYKHLLHQIPYIPNLLVDEVPKDVNIAISTGVCCEDIVVRDYDDAFWIPHLHQKMVNATYAHIVRAVQRKIITSSCIAPIPQF